MTKHSPSESSTSRRRSLRALSNRTFSSSTSRSRSATDALRIEESMTRTPEEETVDKLIADFDSWFQQRGNEPIVRPERAIIKTFCYFLIHEKNRTKLPGEEA